MAVSPSRLQRFVPCPRRRPLGCEPAERDCVNLASLVRGTGARTVAPRLCHSSITSISLAVKARSMNLAMPHHAQGAPSRPLVGRYSPQRRGMCNAVCDRVGVWERRRAAALHLSLPAVSIHNKQRKTHKLATTRIPAVVEWSWTWHERRLSKQPSQAFGGASRCPRGMKECKWGSNGTEHSGNWSWKRGGFQF
jgi:hypothetical protein